MENQNLIIGIIGLIITLFGVIIPIYRYLVDKAVMSRDLRFQSYHEMIKKLVQSEIVKSDPINENGEVVKGNEYAIMLDRQIAVIFELRNYPEYFEVTKRILTDLQNQWDESRTVKEIKYTLTFIEKYNTCRYKFLRLIGLGKLARYCINNSLMTLVL